MQRSITLKIIRPEDETISWEELGYLLRGLSFKVCRMCNFCMTHQLLHALKLETELLNPQGNLYCYPRLAEEYPDASVWCWRITGGISPQKPLCGKLRTVK